MSQPEDEEIDTNILPNKRLEKTKDEILDETFKKAENPNKIKPIQKKIVQKNPFLKSGIIVIIIAILCLAIINYLPWMYIQYEDPELGTIEEMFNKDFGDKIEKYIEKNRNSNSNAYSGIYNVFESQCSNCSNNSNNFIGLTLDDFSNIPTRAFFSFIILALLGLIFTIFQIVDKFRRFSIDTNAIIHSAFAIGLILVCAYLLVLIVKFFGAYILLAINWPFIGLNEIRILFVVPLILIFIIPVIIKGATAIIKMNFNELKKRFKTDIPEDSFSLYKFGGRPR